MHLEVIFPVTPELRLKTVLVVLYRRLFMAITTTLALLLHATASLLPNSGSREAGRRLSAQDDEINPVA